MLYQVYYQRFFNLVLPEELRLEWLPFTHRHLMAVEANCKGDVFLQMQGETWSPNGEARPLLKERHLSHTSLSIGDVIRDEAGRTWVCDRVGWRKVPGQEVAGDSVFYMAHLALGEATFMKISDHLNYALPRVATVETFAAVPYDDLVILAGKLEVYPRLTKTLVCIDLQGLSYQTGEQATCPVQVALA